MTNPLWNSVEARKPHGRVAAGRPPAGKGAGKQPPANARVIAPPTVEAVRREESSSAKRAKEASRELPGTFVSFEGCEGSGKTTQVEMLKDYLLAHGHDVVITREPGGTPIGEQIRKMLLNPDNRGMGALTEALLFAATRSQIVKEVVKPALEKGWVVVADRFVDSSLVYQGVARGLGLEAVKNLNDWATAGLEPDLTVYLDLPFEDYLQRRAGQSPDRIEGEPREFHENVRQAYNLLARMCPQRIVVLDGKAGTGAIHARVVSMINPLL